MSETNIMPDEQQNKEQLLRELAASSAQLEAYRQELAEERQKRQHVERQLQATEVRYRDFIAQAPIGVACIGSDYRFRVVNAAYCSMLGYTEQELTSRTFIEVTHPEDIGQEAHIVSHLFDPATVPVRQEKRYISKAGDILWVRVTDIIIRDHRGAPLYRMNMIEDISRLKREEQTREQVQYRLVTVEEEERRRIARDLHDQTGQQLAALKMAFESWARHNPEATPATQLQALTDFMMEDVQHFTRALRLTELDKVGLDAALRSYIQEWNHRFDIPVDYQSSSLDGMRLSSVHEQTFYRIVQEALTNVQKHADARCVSVVLQRIHNHIQILVEDDGRGFDVAMAFNPNEKQRRLGLQGMRERAALIGGTLTVESSPGTGTTVMVRAPVPE